MPEIVKGPLFKQFGLNLASFHVCRPITAVQSAMVLSKPGAN